MNLTLFVGWCQFNIDDALIVRVIGIYRIGQNAFDPFHRAIASESTAICIRLTLFDVKGNYRQEDSSAQCWHMRFSFECAQFSNS